MISYVNRCGVAGIEAQRSPQDRHLETSHHKRVPMLHSKPHHRFLFLCLIALFAGTSAKADERTEFFEKKIRPVLIEHCYECHSSKADSLKGGLSVEFRNVTRAGGDSGVAIEPGKPDDSLLLSALRYESYEMPPSGELPDHIIKDFETWIAAGAHDPRTDGAVSTPNEIDLAEGRRFWSFQPITMPEVPKVKASDWPRNPIDHFILNRMEQAGPSPAPPAQPTTLLRRIHYDLVGLPPSVEELDQFQQASSPQDLEAVVDRLLESPAFGERWARHWLDIARYADSTGGGRTLLFGDSWKYRDYVIESFNNDKPYDEFVREQIAGDLLIADSLAQRHQQFTATGYLALGPINYELQDKTLLRMEVIDEQINTIGKGMLGMTIGCARCHDHKFDPIPTSDYYALAGIFRSTNSLRPGNVSRWVTRELPLPEEQQRTWVQHQNSLKNLQQQQKDLEAQLSRLKTQIPKSIPSRLLAGIIVDTSEATLVGDWKSSTSINGYIGADYIHDEGARKGEKSVRYDIALPKPGRYEVRLAYSASSNRAAGVPIDILENGERKGNKTINQKKPAKFDGLLASLGQFDFESTATIIVRTKDTSGVVIADAVQLLPVAEIVDQPHLAKSSFKKQRQTGDDAEVEPLEQSLKEVKARLTQLERQSPAKPPVVMSVEEQTPEELGDAHLAIRGNVHNPGPKVPRGVLSVTVPDGDATIKTNGSGRLELANWIASPENPLTARVYVNRVWAHLLGAGLVPTLDNFGSTGHRPTHPELLDYLAAKFTRPVAQGGMGWSTKRLIRELILSRTYQLASASTKQQRELDPENQWLSHARRRRADAEYIRDTLLTLGGQLDSFPGGNSLRPNTKSGLNYRFDETHRSIYLPAFRNHLHDLLSTFDAANPNLVQGQRVNTTMPTQALYLMNSDFTLNQAKHFANRLLREEPTDIEARMERLYKSALGREPTAEEWEVAISFITRTVGQEHSPEVWSQLAHAVFCSLDFRSID